MVIVGHLLLRDHRPGAMVFMLLALLGVQIFFVISGFLITSILLTEHQKNGYISLAGFYRRRCFRIFPAAFAFVLVVAAVYPRSRAALPYALTYTASYVSGRMPVVFAHLWSLSNEEQFYLLWPLALILGFRFRSQIAWIAVIAGVAFSLTFPGLDRAFPASMEALAVGCLAAIHRERIAAFCKEISTSTTLLFLLPGICWLVFLLAQGWPVLGALIPMLLAIWMLALIERKPAVLNNRPIVTIGVLSYSLYLWQQPFTLVLRWATIPSLLGIGACAVASYLLVERPMIALGKGGARSPLVVIRSAY